MDIIEYITYDKKDELIKYLKACEWGASKFLAQLITEQTFEEMLGKDGKVYFLMDQEKVAAFLTLTQKDCIDENSLFPWIGFVYTDPTYRGHRYSGKLIQHALKVAKEQGYEKVYLATDHVGLYEKYGFEYVENRMDVWNEESRIYSIHL
ncbi:GNAT family N-acetyltransferase [Niameybacter massiliensis]|uniref:GNAT family N-acetyltransferase n=1 Tax=Niameybacter massiliensis TaxID=1658108 RepID=UPI0006B4174B|nr:GNAT family N-acetyltransferase [Niameybacter massiliensis]